MKILNEHLFVLSFFTTVLSFQSYAQIDLPIDKNATKETKELYHNLKKTVKKGFLFGQQEATAYGVGWKDKKNKSDIQDVTGDFPGLYGWDLSGVERRKPQNINLILFANIRKLVKQAYQRGGINTFCWHCPSPLDESKGAHDNTVGTVTSILPGGVNHKKYKLWLDEVSCFFLSLRGKHNELIPILFRPYHELTEKWFWWGRTACKPEELKDLWKFTVHYLRDVKQVHSILYVFNTSSDFTNSTEYLERYPGDEFVDVLSFDIYQDTDPLKDSIFINTANTELTIFDNLVQSRNKIEAIAETGYQGIP